MDQDQDYTDWQDGLLNVVCNDRGEYSIWPIDREVPIGWRTVGVSGKKDECLNYIKETWKME